MLSQINRQKRAHKPNTPLQNSSSFSPMMTKKKTKFPSMMNAWQWPSCAHVKTLSFRADAGAGDVLFKTLNSVYLDPSDGRDTPESWFTNTSESASFSTESDDERIIITGVRSDRLFFDRCDTSSSIGKSRTAANPPENQERQQRHRQIMKGNRAGKSRTAAPPPENQETATTPLPGNQEQQHRQRKIKNGNRAGKSRTAETANPPRENQETVTPLRENQETANPPPENQENLEIEKGEEETTAAEPFEESVVMTMVSDDPYTDFKKSMEEMVESQGIKDWESLQELLAWYLKMNGKINHGYIVGAFMDLLVQLTSSSSSNVVVSTSYSSAVSSLSSPPISPLSSLDLKEIEEQELD